MSLVSNILVFIIGLLASTPYIFKWLKRWPSLSSAASAPTFYNATRKSRVELLDRYQVEEKYTKSTWQRDAYDSIVATMSTKKNGVVFPCIYATKAHKENSLIYVFLESADLTTPNNVEAVAEALIAYHKTTCPEVISTLVVITPDTAKTLTVDEYESMFWKFLKNLRQLDVGPRPEDTTDDTAHKDWSFCFDGVPGFMAILTPAHKNRNSRYTKTLTLVYQPRWLFELVMDTPGKRLATTTKIRGLVDRYDYPLEHSPDIANFGEEDATESRQLFLRDENETVVCPFKRL